MSFQAVIFDRDGVLTNFDIEKAAAYFSKLLPIGLMEVNRRWQAWGEKIGFPRNLNEESEFFRSFWNGLCDELSLPDPVRSELLQVDYTEYLFAHPDARIALEQAKAHGLKVGVLSNFSLASLQHSLEVTVGSDLVDVALAAPVIGIAKPARGAYLAIVEALNVEPGQCIFFDDELECVAGAAAVGMAAYRVDRQRREHDLGQSVVANLLALELILDNGNPTG